MKKGFGIFAIVLTIVMALVMVLPVMAADPGVTPSSVTGDLEPGASMTVAKAVQTPVIPPKPDIYFLCDNTGSMGGVIADMQTNADAIMSDVLASGSDAQFGVGKYRDYPWDSFQYVNQQSITADTTAVQTAIDGWVADEGADGAEAWLYALDRIANNPAAMGWRDGSTRIVVMFGDAPGHDPVPMVATTLGYDVTEATVTAELLAANIHVITVNLYGNMDADPVVWGGDYALVYGIIEGGTPGQAGRITTATGGADLNTPTPEEVSAQILAGLESLPITVSWTVTSDAGLVVTLDPVSVTVTSGDIADFDETITAAADAPQGDTLDATVTFVDESGNVLGTETIAIGILDVTAPELTCVETMNPAGKRIPPAGSTTLPGSKGGMNEDGFYLLTATDNVDLNPQLWVVYEGATSAFGPFSSGVVIKFTEDATVPPQCVKMGSTKGKAGYVDYHITLPSDATVIAVDASGNWSYDIVLVPPMPK